MAISKGRHIGVALLSGTAAVGRRRPPSAGTEGKRMGPRRRGIKSNCLRRRRRLGGGGHWRRRRRCALAARQRYANTVEVRSGYFEAKSRK